MAKKPTKWADYKSRKFTLTTGVILLTTAILICHLITGEIWKDVVMGVFGIFMMGHVGEKWAMKDVNQNGIPDELEAQNTETKTEKE